MYIRFLISTYIIHFCTQLNISIHIFKLHINSSHTSIDCWGTYSNFMLSAFFPPTTVYRRAYQFIGRANMNQFMPPPPPPLWDSATESNVSFVLKLIEVY